MATTHVTNAITFVAMTVPHVCQARFLTMTPRGRRCSVQNGASLDLSVRLRGRGVKRRGRYRPHRCRLRGSGRAGLAKPKIRLLRSSISSLKRFARILGRTSKFPESTKQEPWRKDARRRHKIVPFTPQGQHQHQHGHNYRDLVYRCHCHRL